MIVGVPIEGVCWTGLPHWAHRDWSDFRAVQIRGTRAVSETAWGRPQRLSEAGAMSASPAQPRPTVPGIVSLGALRMTNVVVERKLRDCILENFTAPTAQRI